MKTETSLPIADIIIGNRFRKDMGDIAALAETIKSVGMLQPVAINAKKQLVSGQRRLEAAKLLGWTEVPTHVVDNMEDLVRMIEAEEAENTCRKPFTPEEAVDIGRTREELLKPAAEAKIREAGKHGEEGGRGHKKNPLGDSPKGFDPPVEKRRSTTKAAKSVGMGRHKFEQAGTVVDAAREKPETFGPILEEMNTTGNVQGAYKKVQGIQNGTTKKPAVRTFTTSRWEEITKALDKLKQLGNVSTHMFSRLDVRAAINNLYELMHKNSKSS
jgi:ParB family chromosome partitioning protein